ncbi:uncharacterized protein (TIGR03086 family) [Streptomyces sp. Amel2xB2]|uniref:TIGR03086 family metal-binding protein n=1 Tax=Streptomyces sp. Amel2xB2 TaxID=1305829 RepID=UPI000DB9A50C|nr:TIGR03086 family metal-binding protein [Streptomyces sp. Amel2xB2]RAJ62565.1 uncharacterized protein (TIGR03086 family) [Streptomyces sp. Amel2xB2]
MDDGTPHAGAALLERAVGYALCAVRGVRPWALGDPTPCADWDLRALLWHTADSLAALYEGIEDGYVALPDEAGPRADEAQPRPDTRESGPGPESGPGSRGGGDPAAVFRARASRLLGVWTAAGGGDGGLVAVGGLPLPAAALAHAGALEIAVHGWDIAQATGLPRPVPAALATELMGTARQLVPSPAVRQPLFGPPLTVPAEADPSDRLVAFLGRDPYGGRRARRREGGGPDVRGDRAAPA